MMALPGLYLYPRPCMSFTFDLLHPSSCDTMAIYRNMCLPGSSCSCQTVHGIPGIFVTYSGTV